MQNKLILICFSMLFMTCSSFKLVTSSNVNSQPEVNPNTNDENAAYYGKYEFFLDIPALGQYQYDFGANLTVTKRKSKTQARIVWFLRQEQFYGPFVRNFKAQNGLISFVNVDLKNNNESLIQFRLKGENSIEGNVTVLKSNNGDVGASLCNIQSMGRKLN